MLFGIFGKDRIAYVVCSLVGFGVAFALRPATWGPYLGMLFCYHLFLTYLLIANQRKTVRSFNLAITIGCHLLCVLAALSIRFGVVTLLQSQIELRPESEIPVLFLMASRFTRVVVFLVTYALSYLEFRWLFCENRESLSSAPKVILRFVSPSPVDSRPLSHLAVASGEGYRSWAQQGPQQRGSGRVHPDTNRVTGKRAVVRSLGDSPADDFEQWLRARGKTQYSSMMPEPPRSSVSLV